MSHSPSHVSQPQRYYVYVIELSDDMGSRDNPDKPWVYVGESACPPEERFQQHRKGYKASRFVKSHGIRLRPRLSKNFGPYETRAEAKEGERKLAERLRRRGFTVRGGH